MIVILVLVAVASRWLLTATPQALQTPPAVTLASIVAPSPTPTTPPTWTPRPTAPPTWTPKPMTLPTWTPTPTATPIATPAPYSLPTPPVILTAAVTVTVPLPIPTPMPVVTQPEGTINVILLGSDQSSIERVGRTDIIIIASIYPDLPAVMLLSIPRDFYAWIPGKGFDKINTAFEYGERHGYPGGGPALIKATIEYNFGIRAHYYARVGFDGFIKIVDALGGVEVAVECPLSDTFPDPDSPTGASDVNWQPGIHHLDGKHALWYVRSRWRTTDFDRNRRQQQILRGMYRRIMSLNVIPRIPQLWGTLTQAVSTDLGLDELLYLASVGSRLEMVNVKSRFVGRSVLQSWREPDGSVVLVPNYEALGALVAEALMPPARARARQRPFRVEVWNATPYDELGHVAAERLRWEGFEVVSVQRSTEVYPRTQIVDLTTTSKGSPLWILKALYRPSARDILRQPTVGSEVDFKVYLGADYNPCIPGGAIQYIPPGPTSTPIPTLTPTPEGLGDPAPTE